MSGGERTRVVAILLGGVMATAFVVLPLTGGRPVVRVAPFLFAAVAIVILQARPWKWTETDWARIDRWQPSSRAIWMAAALATLFLFWIVITRFRSASINAIDFTVYYDRPSYQTLLGRLQFVESADDTARAYRTYLAVHAHWIMVPLALVYAVWATPLWLLAFSVVAVVAGALYTLRIIQSVGGTGLLASAGAIAFALNDNTARTLNYGFHTEVLYAWSIPWMLHAGITGRLGSFLAAAATCIAIKEDAFLPLAGVAGALFMIKKRAPSRIAWPYVAAVVVVAVLNLVAYYEFLVPRFSATGAPFYASYWLNYGPTATSAALGMLANPVPVAWSTITSSFMPRVMAPFLYVLPFAGWRWCLGIAPIVVLYGASANEQLRAFGIYYAIVLVPFLTLGAVSGSERICRLLALDGARSRAYAAALVVLGALTGGMTDAGYSLRPWRQEIPAVSRALAAAGPDQPVLVQSALYPHAGYAEHVQLLTRETLTDPRFENARLLLAPALSAYPMTREEIEPLLTLAPVTAPHDGLVLVESQGARRER